MKVSFSKSAKGDNGDNKPFFGYCWGFWLPRVSWNHGLPWRDTVTDVSFLWLIFRLNIMHWRQ